MTDDQDYFQCIEKNIKQSIFNPARNNILTRQ